MQSCRDRVDIVPEVVVCKSLLYRVLTLIWCKTNDSQRCKLVQKEVDSKDLGLASVRTLRIRVSWI